MISQSIALVSSLVCRQYIDSENKIPLVITGGGTVNTALMFWFKKSFRLLKQNIIIPNNAVYGTLYGVFINQNKL